MPRPASRRFSWRLLLPLLLLPILAALLLTGYLLHWDDQVRLAWRERSVDAATRAASVWLPDYRLTLQTALDGLEADETSGLTWHAASGTLFTVTGRELVELSPQGQVLRRIALAGFSDPEAVESLGDGRLAIVDERQHLVAVFALTPDAERLDLADMARHDLGFADAGNKGFEGAGWDARRGHLVLAKERDPQGLFSLSLPAGESAGRLQPLPLPEVARDLSALTIDPRTGHPLLLSDESRLLLELDERGEPLSFISLRNGRHGLEDGIEQAEGVAMDEDGTLYLVGEPNRFYVFRRQAP